MEKSRDYTQDVEKEYVRILKTVENEKNYEEIKRKLEERMYPIPAIKDDYDFDLWTGLIESDADMFAGRVYTTEEVLAFINGNNLESAFTKRS